MSSSSHSRSYLLDPYHNTLEVVSPQQRILPLPAPFKQHVPRPTTPLSKHVPANAPSVSSPLSQLTLINTASAPSLPLMTPAINNLTGLVPVDPAGISRSSPSWQAARNSVLSQMVTSQDLPVPATLPRVKTKTGGRRGRGGRRQLVKREAREGEGTTLNSSQTTEEADGGNSRGKGKGRGRGGGRPRIHRVGGGSGRGNKRKRDQSEEEDGAGKDDTDDSENFTPLPTQSRSGRRIFKASTFSPVVIDLETTAGKQPPPANEISGTVEEGKSGRKRYRKPGEASVCKNCGRGHSPRANVIVFCDGCNTPWHQHCHDPPITAEVVRVEEKEWFCGDCEVLREEKAQLEGRVSAEGMSLAEVWLIDFDQSSSSHFFWCVADHPVITSETPLLANSSKASSRLTAATRHKTSPQLTSTLRQSSHSSFLCACIKGYSLPTHCYRPTHGGR